MRGCGYGLEGCPPRRRSRRGAHCELASRSQIEAKAEVAELHAKATEVDSSLAKSQPAVHGAEQEAAEAERTVARAA